MEGVISLSLVNPYTAQRHEMKIEKIYNIFFVHSTNKKERKKEKIFLSSVLFVLFLQLH